jgi:starch-binding outer membrane protein, SusD/RagB family
MNSNKIFMKNILPLTLIVLLLLGCNDSFLTEYPQNELNEGVFWNDEKDALMGLMGCYVIRNTGHNQWGPYINRLQYFDVWTDVGTCMRPSAPTHWPLEGIYPTEKEINSFWDDCYDKISRFNYFLDNIVKVEMDENKKAEMIAEVRFLRGYYYFWLSQLWGDVPFPKTTLTFNEANTISRSSKSEIVDFVLQELTEASIDLPVKRPPDEKGRIEKGAALAIKGRLLMAEKRWSEAAETYKEIIDLNRYVIDPRWKKLFEDEGDGNDESIWTLVYVEGEFGTDTNTRVTAPGAYGGSALVQIFQGFVDKFLMTDGKTIEESPLYNPENPFENRDPRLYATVLLPGYSVCPDGKIFNGQAELKGGAGATGYFLNKFWDHEYNNAGADVFRYGADYMLIRYPEVLLSYLECKIEAGDNITQDLLDNTINKLRSREEVNMPGVTVTNSDELREITRRERSIELSFEGGLRYWDLLRWGIAHEVISGTFYGLKITDNPEEYSGKYTINEKGHIVVETRDFKDYYYLWPIPLDELNINDNLQQNPGYN